MAVPVLARCPPFMLAEFSIWWIRQMADLAAPVAGLLRGGEADVLVLTPGPQPCRELRVARRRKGRLEAAATVPLGDADRLRAVCGAGRIPAILVLPAPPLIRSVELPLAAESSLDRVLRYEMDRLTPFAAEDVFFAHRVTGRDRARAILCCELIVVPKAAVQALLDRLAPAGVAPSALEAAGPGGAVWRIPMVPAEPGRVARERVAWRLAVAACAAMAAATVAVPVLRQSLALAAAEDRMAELRPLVEQAEMLRQRIAAGSAGSGRIAAARRQAAEPLMIMAALTDILPDDTWLDGLSLRERHLVLEGHSAAATRLIAALANEALLHNPSFAAPVTRAETGGEVFTIQAEAGP
jgi:general secretion pathway protein L